MVVAALFGLLSLAAVAAGIAALYEQRLYTPEQRETAPQLFRLRGLLWFVATRLGIVSFALVATGNVGTIID
jgi:hypothetical protein